MTTWVSPECRSNLSSLIHMIVKCSQTITAHDDKNGAWRISVLHHSDLRSPNKGRVHHQLSCPCSLQQMKMFLQVRVSSASLWPCSGQSVNVRLHDVPSVSTDCNNDTFAQSNSRLHGLHSNVLCSEAKTAGKKQALNA